MNAPRIRFDSRGHAQPMGVRKACVKMALVVADSTLAEPLAKSDLEMLAQIRSEIGPMGLTEREAAIAARIGIFYCTEYSRISTANDRLTAENHELTLERRREADGGDQDEE